MPIVLTINEVTLNPDHAWDDVPEDRYHYPNQYKNKVRPGERFVYYRGVHRRNGRRGTAEYFGRGVVGAVRPDPATLGAARPSWYCSIENYEPFAQPVPAKTGGVAYENVPQNMLRNGVRNLDVATYERIINAASLAPHLAGAAAPTGVPANDLMQAGDLVLKRDQGALSPARSGYRRSQRSKEVGDWAEAAVLRHLEALGSCAEIVHRAARGETPGWDIDYRDTFGALHRVEVKGTVSAVFGAVDFTVNELRAAQKHAEHYSLALVAECFTDQPRIQRICNPAKHLASGDWVLQPMLYSIRF